jgi:hypothetical protein
MRVGGPNLKGGPSVTDGERGMTDWLNLPQGTETIDLWACLHDAHVVSVRSNLLDRTMTLTCEIEHLRSFNGLPEGLKFVLSLDGVQSARVLRYAIWPGEFAIPTGVSREEEARLVADYQAKSREESVTWSVFEAAIMRENEQVLDISDATVALSPDTFEQEWRCIRMLKRLERDAGEIYLGQFDPAAISQIIITRDCSVQKELRDLVHTDGRYRHVEIVVREPVAS